MTGRLKIGRRVTAFAIAAIAIVVLVGTASAGPAGAVKTFTGCLVSGDGVIIKVKEGDAPKSACTSGQTLARLSGGDITKISVTGGLTLTNGGESGDVEINLDSKFSLPQGCADGRIAEWDTSTTPDRWICGVDTDTTYSASTGLDLSAGNAFSIDPGYRVPGKSCSTAGEFARGFDSSGAIQCQAPAATGVEVWQKMQPAAVGGGVTVLPKGEGVDVISMSLPAGTFLVTAVATVSDRNSDDEVVVSCELRNGAFDRLPVHEGAVDIGEGSSEATGMVTVLGVISLTNADTVRFTCFSSFGNDDDDQADRATMTAVRVGTVHTQ